VAFVIAEFAGDADFFAQPFFDLGKARARFLHDDDGDAFVGILCAEVQEDRSRGFDDDLFDGIDERDGCTDSCLFCCGRVGLSVGDRQDRHRSQGKNQRVDFLHWGTFLEGT